MSSSTVNWEADRDRQAIESLGLPERSQRRVSADRNGARRLVSIGVAVLAATALFVSGCDQGLSAGVAVDNRTDLELHFVVNLENGPYAVVARAHPHERELVIPATILPANHCTAGGMVALAEDGHEVARHDAPLCDGDTWVIDASPVSPSSSP